MCCRRILSLSIAPENPYNRVDQPEPVSGALVVPENITFLPLPPHSPELNPVENVWAYLRQTWLSLQVWEDTPAIVEACCQA